MRSYVPGDANHDIKPVVHRDTLNANLGSLYSRVAGMNHPQTGMPTNLALFPQSVDAATQPPVLNFGNFMSTGALGGAYAPFVPGGGWLAAAGHEAEDRQGSPRRPPATAGGPRSDAPPDRRHRHDGRDGQARRPGVRRDPARRGRGVRPVEGGPAHGGPLRHGAAGPAGEHQQEVEQPQELRRQRQDARQAAAAGPPPVRGRRRLRDGDDEFRLGHARRREQRRCRRGHGLHGPADGPCGVGLPRRPRSPRPERQDLLDLRRARLAGRRA